MKGHATVGPEALCHDPELARFYDLANGWREDFDFCMRLAEGAASVLDLGYGTGQLAAALAEAGNREVFGADPAEPMLEVARARRGGDRAHWLCADARHVRLGQRFELILMTGLPSKSSWLVTTARPCWRRLPRIWRKAAASCSTRAIRPAANGR